MKKLIKQKYTENPLRFITYTTVGCLCVLPLIAVIAIVMNFASVNFDGREVYYRGYRPTIVITESMEPTIKVNSIVMVKDVSFESIQLGDIIRYNSPQLGISVIHRVEAKGENYLVTKGDNNPGVDQFVVTEDMYNGKIVGIYNQWSGLVTLILGRFDTDNWVGSMARAIAGVVGLAIFIVGVCLLICYIFELVTINWFWTKKTKIMLPSIAWMDTEESKEKFIMSVIRHQEFLKSKDVFFLKKFIALVRFRKMYDVLCTVEKHQKRYYEYRDKCSKCEKYRNKPVENKE